MSGARRRCSNCRIRQSDLIMLVVGKSQPEPTASTAPTCGRNSLLVTLFVSCRCAYCIRAVDAGDVIDAAELRHRHADAAAGKQYEPPIACPSEHRRVRLSPVEWLTGTNKRDSLERDSRMLCAIRIGMNGKVAPCQYRATPILPDCCRPPSTSRSVHRPRRGSEPGRNAVVFGIDHTTDRLRAEAHVAGPRITSTRRTDSGSIGMP